MKDTKMTWSGEETEMREISSENRTGKWIGFLNRYQKKILPSKSVQLGSSNVVVSWRYGRAVEQHLCTRWPRGLLLTILTYHRGEENTCSIKGGR